MIDSARIGRGRQPASFSLGDVRALDGERLAVGATAIGIAALPLLAPRGPGNVAPADALIALALLAFLLWASFSGHRSRFPYVVPMTLFMVGGALGALAGPVPGAGIVALIQDLVLVAWCWAVANVSLAPDRLRTLLATWAYASVAWALVLIGGLIAGMPAITGQTAREGSRTALTFGDPNVSANYYFISMMIIWASGYPRRRGSRLAAYSLLLVALVSTGSNSGIVSVLFGTAVAGLIAVYRRFGIAPVVALSAVLVLAGSLLAPTVSIGRLQAAAQQSRHAFVRDSLGRSAKTAADRGVILRESIRLYRTGGPLGEGPVSTKTRLRMEQAPRVKEAHDDYFAALTERGALGFLGVFLLVASLGIRIFAVTIKPLTETFAAVVVRPYALAGAVAGTLLAGTVYELLHVRHVWTLFALVAGIYIGSREWRASENF